MQQDQQSTTISFRCGFLGGILPYKKDGGGGGGMLVVTFTGENAILVHLSVFSLTRSTTGAFAVRLGVVLELVTLKGEKTF